MPTGYTAAVQDGSITTLRDFALRCARGMGAMIDMRDEPLNAPIPDSFSASGYHREELVKELAKLEALRRTTDDEAERKSASAHEAAMQSWQEREERRAVERKRYEDMMAKVEAWTPPTPDHEPFKAFMAEQLNESIRFDCGFDGGESMPVKKSGAEWLADAIASVEWSVAYHTKSMARDEQNAAERTAWVRALKSSVTEAAMGGN